MQLATASTLHLIIELLYSGKAEIVPELLAVEPIEPSSIVAELQRRSGENIGSDIQGWVDWFSASASTPDSEKETLLSMYQFKIFTRSDPAAHQRSAS